MLNLASMLGVSDEATVGKLNIAVENYLRKYIFSNVDMLLNNCRVLDLSVESLYKKIVIEKRGGYCFEHNKLFYSALVEKKIKTKRLLARVGHSFRLDFPKTHRVSLVEINGCDYLVDVGFGAYTPDSLIPMTGELTLCPNKRSYRINEVLTNVYSLEFLEENKYKALYFFDLNNYTEYDFDNRNLFSNTHPTSRHVNNVVLSKFFNHKIIAILNDNLFIFEKGEKVTIKIETVEKYRTLLLKHFEIEISLEKNQKLFEIFESNEKVNT